jgi:hypothetical protein
MGKAARDLSRAAFSLANARLGRVPSALREASGTPN